jgi:hypothetical protein
MFPLLQLHLALDLARSRPQRRGVHTTSRPVERPEPVEADIIVG